MGFEPMIFWMRTRCPGPLDDGAKKVGMKEPGSPDASLYELDFGSRDPDFASGLTIRQ